MIINFRVLVAVVDIVKTDREYVYRTKFILDENTTKDIIALINNIVPEKEDFYSTNPDALLYILTFNGIGCFVKEIEIDASTMVFSLQDEVSEIAEGSSVDLILAIINAQIEKRNIQPNKTTIKDFLRNLIKKH